MFGLGPTELIIIAIIVLLIFGAKRLPDVGKGLGGAIREFKNVKKELSPEQPQREQGPTEAQAPEADQTSPSLEAKVVNKVTDQIPGVRRAMDVKKKTETIKKLLD
ncbi:MAG: twin-arginine translocase TatA/TatE family subunit [Desulfatiglandaceae bacterium]